MARTNRYATLQLLSLLLAFSAAPSSADSSQYVTELDNYSLLALCAKSALSDNIQFKTASCGDEPPKLQSCICSDDAAYKSVSVDISNSIGWNCGSTASHHLSSAQAVYNEYCSTGEPPSFSTPTTNIVTQMPTDIPDFFDLASCAQSGLSLGVAYMSSFCPDPISLYAPCVCGNTDYVSSVSSVIRTDVSFNCDNNEDITSAQDFFTAWCGMNNGTTSFPQPSNPPGDMSYYISALTQFEDLASCAQSAVDEALSAQTADYCHDGPQALASCVCLKEGIYQSVSSTLTSWVKNSCSSTAVQEVSSAVGVLVYYCEAASGEVTASVAESIDQTYAGAAGSAGGGDGSGPKPTGQADDDDGETSDRNNESNTSNSDDDGGSSTGTNIAVIAGVVVGICVAMSLVCGAVCYCCYKKRAKRNAALTLAAQNQMAASPYAGKPELSGTATEVASPNSDGVSPLSPWGVQGPPPAEMHGHGQVPLPPEAYGSQQAPPAELSAYSGHGPDGRRELPA